MEINNCNWYFHADFSKCALKQKQNLSVSQISLNIISWAFSALRSGMVDLFINRTLLLLAAPFKGHHIRSPASILPYPCAKDSATQRLCGFL